jgi:uncharacterized protein (DUF2249 family)
LQIDLRGLPPPLPMLAILRLVATLDDEQQVTVVHDRDPIYLYPELAAIGWTLVPLDKDGGTMRFTLRRDR